MHKDNIQNLMMANKEDTDMLEFIETRVNSMVDYVAYVSWAGTRIQRMQAEGIDGEDWRVQVSDLDARRRDKHEVVLSAVNQLNRLAASSGLPLLYDGPVDHDHRNQVGDFCLEVVGEYFKGRNQEQNRTAWHARPLSAEELMGDGASFEQAVTDLGTSGGAGLIP